MDQISIQYFYRTFKLQLSVRSCILTSCCNFLQASGELNSFLNYTHTTPQELTISSPRFLFVFQLLLFFSRLLAGWKTAKRLLFRSRKQREEGKRQRAAGLVWWCLGANASSTDVNAALFGAFIVEQPENTCACQANRQRDTLTLTPSLPHSHTHAYSNSETHTTKLTKIYQGIWV